MYRKLTVLLLMFSLPLLAMAGTIGKVAGTVIDEGTGQRIAGANVYLEGTSLGAASDIDGYYEIVNVPAGKYVLTCSVMGYAQMNVENLTVIPDYTTTQEFFLTQTTIQGETITVVAERPLIQLDKTSSVQITSADEIRELPISGYKELVTIQSGITEFTYNVDNNARFYNESTNGPKFMVRGGRPEEVMFNIDGIAMNDPYSGYVTLNVPELAWNDFVLHKGNFSAQYGRYMSGVVNYATKSGGDRYSLEAEVSTDNISGDEMRHDQNLYSFAFGGPVLPGNQNYKFFFAGDYSWNQDRNPSIAWDGMNMNNYDRYYSYFGKLTGQLSDQMRLDLGVIGSQDDWLEYRHSYYFATDHLPRYRDINQVLYARFNHSVNTDLFYTLSASHQYVSRLRGDRSYFSDDWADRMKYGRTLMPTQDETTLFHPETDPAAPWYEQFSWRNFLNRNTTQTTFKFDLNQKWQDNHDITAGFEYQYYTIRSYEHYFAHNIAHMDPDLMPDTEDRASIAFREANFFGYDLTGRNEDNSSGLNAAKHPTVMGAYFADKFNWDDVIIDLGVRWDYLDPATKRLVSESRPLDPTNIGDDQLDEDTDLEDAETHSIISPRLGVSFPVSDVTTYHFNFGKYTQFPPLYTLYVNYDYMAHMIKDGGYHVVFGNPNLKPEQTVAYEFGFSHQMGQYAVIDMTAFYKNVSDLVNSNSQESFPTSFSTYQNMDHSVVKGFEFEAGMKEYRGIAAKVNYTLSWAYGTGSGAESNDRIAHTSADPPKMTMPLNFDVRHNLKGALTYSIKDDEGPEIFGSKLLANTAYGLTFTANSGHPYTKDYVYNEISLGATFPTPEQPMNDAYTPWVYNTDLHVAKNLAIAGVGMQFYLDIRNLFDVRNQYNVYQSSGSAETTYWLNTDEGKAWLASMEGEELLGDMTAQELYELRELNPNNFGSPRIVMVGLNVSL